MYANGLPAVFEKASGDANDWNPAASPDLRFHNNTYPRHDWAMVPYQVLGRSWENYWIGGGPRNEVVSWCMSGGSQNCTSGTHAIIGMYTHAQMQVGWVVCATGSGTGAIYAAAVNYSPGSRCGSIQSKNMIDYYEEGANYGWGVKVDICGRDGDSGGPLFSQLDNRAYGILSGGPTRSGPCDRSNRWEYSVYSTLSENLANAKAKTGKTFSLITGYWY
jgi:streptogrisin C